MITPDLLSRFAAALGVLSRLQLAPADQETMDQVVALSEEWPLSEVTGADSDSSRLLASGWEELRTSRAAGESTQDVARDQDRLYGISANAAVAPFESVHRDEAGLVFDTSTLEVRAVYQRAGLRAPAFNREPDDHLGLEIDFLSRCCTAALDALDRGDDDIARRYTQIAREFTDEHLITWVPAVLQQAHGTASTHWLRGIEDLTLASVLTWAASIGFGDVPRDGTGEYAVVCRATARARRDPVT